MGLGEIIRQVRKATGKTQAEFARSLGMKQNTISQYESEQITPSRSNLLLIASAAEGALKEQILHDLGFVQFSEVVGLTMGQIADLGLEDRSVDPETLRLLHRLKELSGGDVIIHPAVTKIVDLWIGSASMRRAGALFDKAATWLEVELLTLAHKAPRSEVGRPPLEAVRPPYEKADPRYRTQSLGLWMFCPQKYLPFYTGFSMSQERFDQTRIEDRVVPCPHCHSDHKWSKKDVYLDLPGPT